MGRASSYIYIISPTAMLSAVTVTAMMPEKLLEPLELLRDGGGEGPPLAKTIFKSISACHD